VLVRRRRGGLSYLNSCRLCATFVLSIYFVFGDDFAPALQEQKETRSQLTSADDNNNDRSVYDERPRARDVCARLFDVFTHSARLVYFNNSVLRYYRPWLDRNVVSMTRRHHVGKNIYYVIARKPFVAVCV